MAVPRIIEKLANAIDNCIKTTETAILSGAVGTANDWQMQAVNYRAAVRLRENLWKIKTALDEAVAESHKADDDESELDPIDIKL